MRIYLATVRTRTHPRLQGFTYVLLHVSRIYYDRFQLRFASSICRWSGWGLLATEYNITYRTIMHTEHNRQDLNYLYPTGVTRNGNIDITILIPNTDFVLTLFLGNCPLTVKWYMTTPSEIIGIDTTQCGNLDPLMAWIPLHLTQWDTQDVVIIFHINDATVDIRKMSLTINTKLTEGDSFSWESKTREPQSRFRARKPRADVRGPAGVRYLTWGLAYEKQHELRVGITQFHHRNDQLRAFLVAHHQLGITKLGYSLVSRNLDTLP